jgi:hypothetical protein
VIGELSREIVRCVAALALDPLVKRRVACRRLVAGAAVADHRVAVLERRVRIVAADAARTLSFHRVIGGELAVALLASVLGAPPHVVRRVAAVALLVRGNATFAEHEELVVAAPAPHGGSARKVVGPVAADALEVSAREERGLGHSWFVLPVAVEARAERVRGERVLLLVARGAHLVRRLSRERVRGRDRRVTVGARSRSGRRVSMRLMAIDAGLALMDAHRGRLSLWHQVTMGTVPRSVGVVE